MKHLFISLLLFIFLITCILFFGAVAEGATTFPSCPTRPPNDCRGPPGLPGNPGQKGERGENSQAEATGFEGNITEMFVALRRGYMELDDGWITPFDGFQYKLVTTLQNWQSSRSICQSLGGDLATYGIQDWGTRRIILNTLNTFAVHIWVGFSDEGNEGTWRWTNGRSFSTEETVLWHNGEPNGGSRENCGSIRTNSLFMFDLWCTYSTQALCQKPI